MLLPSCVCVVSGLKRGDVETPTPTDITSREVSLTNPKTAQGRQDDLIKAKALRPDAQSQSWESPRSLPSLLEAVRSARASGKTVRVVGGNTGPGVYKDWPVDVDVLIGTTGVKELTGITSHQVRLFLPVVQSCWAPLLSLMGCAAPDSAACAIGMLAR